MHGDCGDAVSDRYVHGVVRGRFGALHTSTQLGGDARSKRCRVITVNHGLIACPQSGQVSALLSPLVGAEVAPDVAWSEVHPVIRTCPENSSGFDGTAEMSGMGDLPKSTRWYRAG